MKDRASIFVDQFCKRNSCGLCSSDMKLMARMLRKEFRDAHNRAQRSELLTRIERLNFELDVAQLALGVVMEPTTK